MPHILLVRITLVWNFEIVLVHRFFTNSLAHAFCHIVAHADLVNVDFSQNKKEHKSQGLG